MRVRPLLFSSVCLMFSVMLSLLFSPASYAVERPFPDDAKLGTLNLTAKRSIVINKKVRKLTAGAQIRDQKNKIIQRTMLFGQNRPILYTENVQGQIERLWILTYEEVQKYSSDRPPTPPPVAPDRTARSSSAGSR